MKELIVKILKKALKDLKVKVSDEEIEKSITTPPSSEMGDYAFPCFFLAKKLKDPPHQIAMQIREAIGNEPPIDFEDVQTVGPYVNFFMDRKELARKAVWEIIEKRDKYGRTDIGKNKKLIVEFSDPNIAKPFGIGHLRSTIIGNSIANISQFLGYKVVRINYLGDWGTQFGKVLFGYDQWGDQRTLKDNPIKHLYELYVKANKKKYENQGQKWFRKLEEKDKESVVMWRIFKEHTMNELDKIYKLMDIKFNEITGESDAVKKANEVINELKEKKLMKKSKGAEIVNLKNYGLGVCMIKKSDEGTTYALRDLAAAIQRYRKHKFVRMIYEVGHEQELHFRQIFKVLELMGYDWAKDCIHIDHGLYLGNNGKKFSTRKGKTVFLEEIIDKVFNLAKKEIKKRDPKLSGKRTYEGAMKVALAAIFYGDLKNNRKHDIIFDLERIVSFEGNTGPYIQYSYARAGSILKKAKSEKKFEIRDLDEREIELVKKLLEFPDIVLSAYESLNPSIIANYSFQIAKAFNEFYHACPVLNSEEESFRLALTEAFRQVLRNAFGLLGIKLLEEM